MSRFELLATKDGPGSVFQVGACCIKLSPDGLYAL